MTNRRTNPVTPRKILALMMLKGVRSVDIAQKLGVNRSSVSGVIHGKRRSRRVETAIANALGKRYEDIWSTKE